MHYHAIIPARAGSKGIRKKNIREIAGMPLIAWSIRQALAVPSISHVVVSTDSDEIAGVAREHGAEVPFLRPAGLAQDETPTEPVLAHALEWYEAQGVTPRGIILLQPTSPLRLPGTLARAIEQFEREKADSLLGVCEYRNFFWRDTGAPQANYDLANRPRRQDFLPKDLWYTETGSIYITATDTFKICHHRLGGRISMYVMREEEGWQIDSEMDFAIVSALLTASLALKCIQV